MCASDVGVVCGVAGKGLSAVSALEGLLSTVLTDVGTENGARGEGLGAVQALVRSLPAASHILHFELGERNICRLIES